MKRLIIQTSIWLAATGLLLFWPAGTIAYPGGWIFIIEMALSSAVIGLWLLKHDPQLLQKRLGAIAGAEGQQVWDSVLLVVVFAAFNAWIAFMAWDGGRHRFAAVPPLFQGLGAALMALCMIICWATFRENSFAAPVVKVQAGQTTISTGPYAIVRHPMYAGALLYFAGVPLLLGSWTGLAIAPLLALMMAWRATQEEKLLRAELAGYADYLGRVRYRFIPLIW